LQGEGITNDNKEDEDKKRDRVEKRKSLVNNFSIPGGANSNHNSAAKVKSKIAIFKEN